MKRSCILVTLGSISQVCMEGLLYAGMLTGKQSLASPLLLHLTDPQGRQQSLRATLTRKRGEAFKLNS